jgi:adenine phosphoribosyltransferase
MERLDALVRDVPDFPKPGIVFKDITPVLAHPEGLRMAVEAMIEPWKGERIDRLVCIESRGFIFGAAMALRMGIGMAPVRKPGKLPWRTRRAEYTLEYGTDALEIHEDAVGRGERVLVVDDLLATGGTASAVVGLVGELGAEVVGASFLIELGFLKGRSRVGTRVEAVLKY